MSNPLSIYLGLLLILLGVLAMYAGVKDRRTAIAVSGFLFLVAGAGLAVLGVAVAW